MWFEVGESVVAHEASAELKRWCQEELELDNPEFEKKQSMGLWTGSMPRKIALYEKRGNNIIIPFGSVLRLRNAFPDFKYTSAIKPPQKFDYASGISLYDYQQEAVNKALEFKNGVLVMPCGSGKTQTGLEIVSRLGVKALWLTHTQDLLNQSMNRAKSVLGCAGYGTITGGKVDIGSGLTFATVQTMARIDLPKFRNEWGCVVVDECHRCIGSPTRVMQFYKVLSNVSCRHKFGLTATPRRADGLEKSMFSLLGEVIHAVGKDAVAKNICPVHVNFIPVDFYPGDCALMADGTLNYAGLVSDMCADQNRFNIVSEAINRLPKGNPILVLANRVEYLKSLDKAYQGRSVCLSGLGNSKSAREARNRAIADLGSGRIDALFATYQLAKEGLDCPNLRYVVFATPEKDPTTIQQASGRVERKAEGKEFGTIIDFVDSFPMYLGWAKKRGNLYRKFGYSIIEET